MERLAIIDHDTHQLFIEDVTDEQLFAYGDEQAFIDYNYGENVSWDYVISVVYYNEEKGNTKGQDIDFDE